MTALQALTSLYTAKMTTCTVRLAALVFLRLAHAVPQGTLALRSKLAHPVSQR